MITNNKMRTCQVAVPFKLWNRMLAMKAALSTEEHVVKLKELLERAIEEFLERQEERVSVMKLIKKEQATKEGK